MATADGEELSDLQRLTERSVKRITCNLPDSLYEALVERMASDKTSCDHVVSMALSQCLGKPIHTLFQVSTSAALVEVEGLYQASGPSISTH